VPIDVQATNIDLLSFSAHKIYGPKGVGAFFRRRSNPHVLLSPLFYGGGHERGLRSGTLPVPSIVGFGEALRIAKLEMKKDAHRYRAWTQELLARLSIELGGVELNGHPTQRLPHNLNISIKDIESRAMVVRVSDVAFSTGSACTSASVEPSHVIQALGFGDTRAHSALRLSVGRLTTDEQMDRVAQHIVRSVRELRAFLNS
jgi:cysteine desulfurase